MVVLKLRYPIKTSCQDRASQCISDNRAVFLSSPTSNMGGPITLVMFSFGTAADKSGSAINTLANCKLRSVITFLWCKGTSPIKFHCQLTKAYNEQYVECQKFIESYTNVNVVAVRGSSHLHKTLMSVQKHFILDRCVTV